MVQGGANTNYTENFVQDLVELIQGNEGLKKAAEDFLKGQSITDMNLADLKEVTGLLDSDKGTEFLTAVSKQLSEEEKFKKLVEQIGKDRVMVEKLETLGNRLLINRIVGGAAFATLTGALAGTLAIGGVVGALIVGGAVLAGFLAIAAIVAIGYAIYQHRGEIKEGVIEAGKAIKGFVKNVIDKLPVIQIQDRDKNFYKLYQESSRLVLRAESEEIKNIQDKARIIDMLQNEEKRSAIKELIKDGTIQNFSEDETKRLIEKGLSTHETDMKALDKLVKKFLPEIMTIGSNIKEVEQRIDAKVQEMEPKHKLNDPNSKQVVGPGKHLSP